MLRGFYTAASGMISQQRHQDALSNNITNANTPGYKADQTTMRAFPELLMQQMGSTNVPTSNGLNIPNRREVGPLNTGVYAQEMIPNFIQGDLKETNVSTDMALVHGDLPDEDGNLFFSVQDETGETQFTRNGNFTVDGHGMLVTNEGYYVLDEAGNQIETDGLEFTVSDEGNLQIGAANIPLGIAYVEDANSLEKVGDGRFSGEGVQALEGINYSVKQGFLEQSNVDELQSMTDMMTSYRSFETNQRVLKAYDESMGKAVNEIGRLG